MPAPLGKVPTKKMPNIQVFGMDDSNATRNALRFFRDRIASTPMGSEHESIGSQRFDTVR